jgi:hypothetical protein
VVFVAASLTPAGRASMAAVDGIDSAIAFARADSAGDRAWAVASAMASMPLPGFKGPGAVASVTPAPAVQRAVRPGSILDAGGRAAAGTPDVYAISLVRRQGKEVEKPDRVWARQVADRLGHVGPVDVGHAPGYERVMTPKGGLVWLRPEPSGPNRAAGSAIARMAAFFRSNKYLGVFVRPKK